MKTLLILHGWQSSKEKWQAVKEKIEQYNENSSRCIRVTAPDLPGFKKETGLTHPWDLGDYLNWLEKFSSEIPEPFFLLGHSFGGRLAIKFALRHPEKLNGLILVGTAGIKHKKTSFELFLSKIAKMGNKFYFLPFFSFFRKIFYRFIVRKTDYLKTEGLLKETFKKIVAEDLTPFLPQVQIPCLIIWGKNDKITPLEDANLLKEKIKNSRLEILENVGHTPYLETPEKLAEIIINFLSRSFKRGGIKESF
ncbi:alpha/beta hydrolase [Patescibacteria group bacterium]|nr:alpha/beta hydrolase [Patescibacteria group bacterium]MBU4481719.1 alpha/beta hydrolase [Patescibacteria group bacterium]